MAKRPDIPVFYAPPTVREIGSPTRRPAPLLWPAVAFIAGICAAEYAGLPSLSPAVALTLLLSLTIFTILFAMRGRNDGRVAVACVTVLALLAGYARHNAATRPAPNDVARVVTEEGMLARIAGVVATQPTFYAAEKRNPFLPYDPKPRTRFLLDVTESLSHTPPTPMTGPIRVTIEAEHVDLSPGQRVTLTGRLYRPRGPRNPGEFDWRQWNRLQGVHAAMFVESPDLVRPEPLAGSWRRRLSTRLRGAAQSLLFEPFADAGEDDAVRVLDAMVLGRRSSPTPAINDAFLRTGTIHYLTVSGFHVGVLGWGVWWLLRRVLRGGRRLAASGTIVALITYALIAEPNAPILRATTMGVLLCLAQMSDRPFNSLNWLACSAIGVLLFNPLELFRPGFQLSFVQVLALLTLVPRVYRALVHGRADSDGASPDADSYGAFVWRQTHRWVLGLVVISVLAWLVSLPLVLLHFERFAPWAPVQSLVITPIVLITVMLGFAVLFIGAVPIVGPVIGGALHLATHFLLTTVNWLASWPHTLIEVHAPPAALVWITYGLGIAAYALWTQPIRTQFIHPALLPRRRLAIAALVTCIPLVWLGWVLAPRASRDDLRIYVLSVSDGSATLVIAPEGDAMLIDAGTLSNFDAGETVVRAMKALNVTSLKAVAISHANSDHYGGVPTVTAAVPAAELRISPQFEQACADTRAMARFVKQLGDHRPLFRTTQAGDEFPLGSARVEVLWPPADLLDESNVNDRSLVLRITYAGRAVLIPGDIEQAAESALLAANAEGKIDLATDVLIAPHHGATGPASTAVFLEETAPQTVVVSCARDRSHFVELAHQVLGESTPVLLTRDVGAIVIHVSREGRVTVDAPY